MTLKMQNPGVDASKSLRRTSSLIKARVTRELPGLPSLQPMHHVLSGAESILARLMRLSSKVGTVIPEEAGEAAAQSGASSAAVSAAQSGGQAADAANAQVRRDAPQQQAQQPAISEQQAQQPANHEQQAQQPAFPQQQAQQPAIPEQQAQQLANPEQQQAQHGPQQAQHVPYYGPRQPPAYVPAAAVPAPVVQQVPVMAPAPMPVITARVTNVQVVAGLELARDAGTQEAAAKVHKRVTKKAKALKVLRKLVCLPPSSA